MPCEDPHTGASGAATAPLHRATDRENRLASSRGAMLGKNYHANPRDAVLGGETLLQAPEWLSLGGNLSASPRAPVPSA